MGEDALRELGHMTREGWCPEGPDKRSSGTCAAPKCRGGTRGQSQPPRGRTQGWWVTVSPGAPGSKGSVRGCGGLWAAHGTGRVAGCSPRGEGWRSVQAGAGLAVGAGAVGLQ